MNKFNFTTLKQKSRHLDIINELALNLLRTSDLDEILWLVAKSAIANLDFEDCVIYLFDSDGKTLIQRAAFRTRVLDLKILVKQTSSIQ